MPAAIEKCSTGNIGASYGKQAASSRTLRSGSTGNIAQLAKGVNQLRRESEKLPLPSSPPHSAPLVRRSGNTCLTLGKIACFFRLSGDDFVGFTLEVLPGGAIVALLANNENDDRLVGSRGQVLVTQATEEEVSHAAFSSEDLAVMKRTEASLEMMRRRHSIRQSKQTLTLQLYSK